MILALDISTSCTGWAVIDRDDKLVKYGKIIRPNYFANLSHNDLLMSKALYWYCREINKLIKQYQPIHICAEDINVRYILTLRTMAQFHAAASIAVSIAIDGILHKVHNATIRSVFGFNNTYLKQHKKDVAINKIMKAHKVDFTKVLIVNKINKLYDLKLDYSDHDIADAIAVGYTFIRKNYASPK